MKTIIEKVKSWYEVYKFNKRVPIVCAWCGLVKTVNIFGQTLWPEPWIQDERDFCKKDDKTWKRASHGMCPECFNKQTREVA